MKKKPRNLWKAPFRVVEKISDANYHIELPNGKRLYSVIYANWMRIFIDRMHKLCNISSPRLTVKNPILSSGDLRDIGSPESMNQDRHVVLDELIEHLP